MFFLTRVRSLSSSLVIFAFVTPTTGQNTLPKREIPGSRSERVDQLVGESLQGSSRSRKGPDSLAWDCASAFIADADLSIPALDNGLSSENALQRVNIIWVLARIGTQRSVPPRIRDNKTSKAAAVALGKLNHPKAIGPLGSYLKRNVNSEEAVEALSSVRHPEAVLMPGEVAATAHSGPASAAFGEMTGIRLEAPFGFPEQYQKRWLQIRQDFERDAGL